MRSGVNHCAQFKTIAEAKAKALALAQETHARLIAETEANRLALKPNSTQGSRLRRRKFLK